MAVPPKKNKKLKILIIVLAAAMALFAAAAVLNPSPYYTLVKHSQWQAQEVDCRIVLTKRYKAKRKRSYYYSETLDETLGGKLIKDGKEYDFAVQTNPMFERLDFGNMNIYNTEPLNSKDPFWMVEGVLTTYPWDVITAGKIRIHIVDIVGDVFPKDIKTLTFVPEDEQ